MLFSTCLIIILFLLNPAILFSLSTRNVITYFSSCFLHSDSFFTGDAANAGQVEEVKDEDDEDGEGDMMVVAELDNENHHEVEEDIMMLEKDEEEEGEDEEDDVPANAKQKKEKTVDMKDEPRNKRTKTSNSSESNGSKVHAPVEVDDVAVKKELKKLVTKSPAKSDEKKKKRQSLRK